MLCGTLEVGALPALLHTDLPDVFRVPACRDIQASTSTHTHTHLKDVCVLALAGHPNPLFAHVKLLDVSHPSTFNQHTHTHLKDVGVSAGPQDHDLPVKVLVIHHLASALHRLHKAQVAVAGAWRAARMGRIGAPA